MYLSHVCDTKSYAKVCQIIVFILSTRLQNCNADCLRYEINPETYLSHWFYLSIQDNAAAVEISLFKK